MPPEIQARFDLASWALVTFQTVILSGAFTSQSEMNA
jgi:hypothetical protein